MVPTCQTRKPSLTAFCQEKSSATGKFYLQYENNNTNNPFLLNLFVWHLREWHNDEKGSIEALVLHEVSDEGDGLDCFTKAHLISQNTIQVVVVK